MSWRGPDNLPVAAAWRTAGRLTWNDWTVLAGAAALLAATTLALRLVRLPRLLRAARALASARPRRDAGADAERLLWLVSAAAGRSIPTPTCLAKAIVAFVVLRRRAFPARLVIGATTTRGTLEGHAWVELGTDTVTAQGSGAYVPLVVLDDPGRPARVARSEPTA